MTDEGWYFKNKYKKGSKIKLKKLEELNQVDNFNVTVMNRGKKKYLGQTLTVVDWMETAGNNKKWSCLAEEDNGSYCWFDSMIVQDGRVVPKKTNTLPFI